MRAVLIGGTLVLAAAAACSSFAGESAPPSGGADAAVEAAADDGGAPTCDPAAVANDPKNCGACGHDCLGGACSANVCQPVLVGEQDVDAPIVDVAVQGDAVLWVAFTDADGAANARSGLYTCAKAGGTPREFSGARYPGNLASDGTRAFVSFVFGGVNAIYEIGLDGTLSKLPPSHMDARALAVRADGLYYTALYEGNTGFSRRIFRWDWSASMESPVAAFDPPDGVNTFATAYSNDRLYLGSHSTDYIGTAPIATGVFTSFLSASPATTNSIAASATKVFWQDYDSVYSCPNGDKCVSPKEELTKQDLGNEAPRTVTMLGDELAIMTGSALHVCDPSSCRPTLRKVAGDTMSVDQALYGHAVTADAKAYYYGVSRPSADGGRAWRVMKVAK